MSAFPRKLLDGYRTFCVTRLPIEQERFQTLAERGQQPEVMIIGCCDSRVSPEVIFNAGPGELFVVRNVANLVPPYSPDSSTHGVSAAIEFAVQGLKVKHIVILGHGRCGGIRAYAAPETPLSDGDFIGRWMALIRPAAARLGPPPAEGPVGDYLEKLEKASIAQTLINLATFPFVRDRQQSGDLQLHGAYFGVATGQLEVCDDETGDFTSVNAK